MRCRESYDSSLIFCLSLIKVEGGGVPNFGHNRQTFVVSPLSADVNVTLVTEYGIFRIIYFTLNFR